MSESITYVRIVGEPFLSRAREYRERQTARRRAIWEYAQSKGATGFSTAGTDLCFKGRSPPKNWTKPKGEHGFSHPKVGTPEAGELQRLRSIHPQPVYRDVYGDGLCEEISWEASDGSSGTWGIADGSNLTLVFEGAWLGWAGDTFFGLIPDAEAERHRYATKHPERTVVGPAATWTLPEGLVRITKAEMDLIVAEHRVAEERAKASAPSARPLALTGEG
ncbi:hypothetical protein HNR00_003615 [Methylorubrum rhodinum]|uniref:Uncharacterized protein n=1 Tax=Methylorubrum rhodinum TaxID=29428 RepID=A0A840ZPB2_9HYPH|nr:hypothetical protein [Methylorubrum rhodinum]MBB5758888.1 hypothetical protein [Methylorubrum rhodinum]